MWFYSFTQGSHRSLTSSHCSVYLSKVSSISLLIDSFTASHSSSFLRLRWYGLAHSLKVAILDSHPHIAPSIYLKCLAFPYSLTHVIFTASHSSLHLSVAGDVVSHSLKVVVLASHPHTSLPLWGAAGIPSLIYSLIWQAASREGVTVPLARLPVRCRPGHDLNPGRRVHTHSDAPAIQHFAGRSRKSGCSVVFYTASLKRFVGWSRGFYSQTLYSVTSLTLSLAFSI